MSENAPLRPVVEPGEHRVRWEVPSESGTKTALIEGNLELLADAPPKAIAYGDAPDLAGVQVFPHHYESGVVRGHLIGGYSAMLIDAEVEAGFPDRTWLHSRAVLVSRAVATKAVRVKKIRVQVQGLDVIAAQGPIYSLQYPSRNADKPNTPLEWTIRANRDSEPTWSDAGATVSLRWRQSASGPNPFFFRLHSSPYVVVELMDPISFDEAFDLWVDPLRRIVSLSTGRAELLTFVQLDLLPEDETRTDTDTFQVFGSAIGQAPYASTDNPRGILEPAFLVGADERSLLDLLRNWQSAAADHHPLLETYASLMYARDQHPRSRFLLLVQALEGLHGHVTFKDWALREAAHKVQWDKVMDAVKASGLGAEVEKFIKEHLGKRPKSGLSQALRWALDEVPVDIRPALEASKLLASAANTYDGIQTVRNDLAHGNRGYDVRDLNELVQPLDGVVRAHLMAALGCSLEDQERVQKQSRRL